MVYAIASPDEYLAITGAGIKTLKIVKAAWVWPFQRVRIFAYPWLVWNTHEFQCQRFSIQPHDYSMNLQAMTREKLQFLLPVVFTVGPDVNQRGAIAGQSPRDTGNVDHNPEDHGDALMKYAMLLADAEREAKGASK